MKSCLYRARVMHNRMEPKKHRFHYSIFMFSLDLDELDEIIKNTRFMSRNHFNLFSFYDRDHHVNGIPENGRGVRQELNEFLRKNNIAVPSRIQLITNLRLLGYVFNPVSFYFCFNERNEPLCAVAEVQNTYKEMKLFLLDTSCYDGTEFHLRTPKYFYVSPFIDHDAEFDFHLVIPGEKMNIRIDDIKDGRRFFISTLTGEQRRLTSTRLAGYFFRFPFVTLKIITLIHWNAMLLWMKKIRFFRKKEFPELQRDVARRYEDQ